MKTYDYTIWPKYGTGKYEAILNKGDDKPFKSLGMFPNTEAARAACKAHYTKASKFLTNIGKPVPDAFFG